MTDANMDGRAGVAGAEGIDGASTGYLSPLNICILGSCVGRDTLETMDRDQYPITTYVSRHSLLSAGSDASPNLPATYKTSSKFQLRNVRRDVKGHLLRTIVEEGDADVLLWDLVDERHGVYEFADGSVMTRSIDVLGIPALQEAVEGARHVPFGSEEHFLRWVGAANLFLDALDVLGLRDRVLVIAVAWATHDLTGSLTPPSMGVRADEANRTFARYYDHLERQGLRVFHIEDPLADPEHRWGLAPFHYAPDVYARVHAAIDAFAADRGVRA